MCGVGDRCHAVRIGVDDGELHHGEFSRDAHGLAIWNDVERAQSAARVGLSRV